MKIFFDSDVLLDLLMKRKPFSQDILELLVVLDKLGSFNVTSVLAAANIHYILGKNISAEKAKELVTMLTGAFQLIGVTASAFHSGHSSNFKDFEDGIQYQCCLENQIDYIITRNTKDYKLSSIPVFKADEMIVHIFKNFKI